MNARLLCALPTAVLAAAMAPCGARADAWHVGFATEAGSPSGYVQVRENRIDGTPLDLRGDLGVTRSNTVRIRATRGLGHRGQLHLWLSGTQLPGSATLRRTAYFNGATLAPGPVSSETGYTDYLRFQASYWYKLAGFGHGGRIWLSGGLTFVSLNFRMRAPVAAGSAGRETKEDFNTQELPVPLFGIHVTYPAGSGLTVFADFTGGHLPWTNSLRREGGMVQVTQTNRDADLGLRYRFARTWTAGLYVFDRRYMQNERSAEDGNYVHIDRDGIGLEFADRF